MIVRFIFIIAFTCFLTSCKHSLQIPFDNECELIKDPNIEKVVDFKIRFSAELPKNWKINLYYDDVQSSIYAADTTKQLTEAILLDISFIDQKISLDDLFSLKQEQEHLQKRLIKTNTFTSFTDRKSIHHSIFKGNKEGFAYQKHIIHIKETEENFVMASIELYGDKNVEDRICKALRYLESIKLVI